MKTLLGLLGASFMAVSILSAAPNMNHCNCRNCTCAQEAHCGCYSESGCNCHAQKCHCGDDCKCGSDCDCN